MVNTEIIQEKEENEIKLLLEAIYMHYGYDFRDYSQAHIKRRLRNRLAVSGLDNISQLIERVFHDSSYFDELIKDFSINVTEMFRHPPFFKELREKVIPYLRTFPNFKIWIAGCSSGEEVFSLTILLKEEGLLHREDIFATDINMEKLAEAKNGIFPAKEIKAWTENYQVSGGAGSFSEYYVAKFKSVIFNPELIKNVTFMQHDLVQDNSFIEANLILCRNVMIYFNVSLQTKVLDLFFDSLKPGGILGIGSKESLKLYENSKRFENIEFEEKIFRKML